MSQRNVRSYLFQLRYFSICIVFLKKFSSSASICLAFRGVKPSSFFNAVICFFLWFLFSKLRKYLLFFSPNSYQRALLRTIVPWVFLTITLASLLFTRSISAFFTSSNVERICSCRISDWLFVNANDGSSRRTVEPKFVDGFKNII